MSLVDVNEFFASRPSLEQIQKRFGVEEPVPGRGEGANAYIYDFSMPPLIPDALYVPGGFIVHTTNGVFERWGVISDNLGTATRAVSSGGFENGTLRIVLSKEPANPEMLEREHKSADLQIPDAVFQVVRFADGPGEVVVVVPERHARSLSEFLRLNNGQLGTLYVNELPISKMRLDPSQMKGSQMVINFSELETGNKAHREAQ